MRTNRPQRNPRIVGLSSTSLLLAVSLGRATSTRPFHAEAQADTSDWTTLRSLMGNGVKHLAISLSIPFNTSDYGSET